eukprot:TRINITY_DN20816_c0_g1_i1.p1 TRINITY_DN20816_c0_g1~~TRINITY_DN20816_c0_g1_i1.p1  ORF type:complete len:346 (+),score=100.10 TRINITY_DN20816_c0_g1_i1:77-1039(+)
MASAAEAGGRPADPSEAAAAAASDDEGAGAESKQARKRKLKEERTAAKKAERRAAGERARAAQLEEQRAARERHRILPAEPPPPHVLATPQLEGEHVHRVYDSVAAQWSRTRYKAWPRVAGFLQALPPGSLVCDAGCGNGKHHGVAPGVTLLGSDMSGPLLSEAAQRNPLHAGGMLCRADCLRLPLRAASFDAAISIAVLHHLSTPARRIAALRELLRVARRGAPCLVYAWAQEQHDGVGSRGDWGGLAAAGDCSDKAPTQDVLVPFGKGSAEAAGEVPPRRYCHLFREGELEGLVGSAGGRVRESWYDSGNWCAVLCSE